MSKRNPTSLEKPVTFNAEGQQILGVLHLPQSASPCPAVLFFHGFTGSKHETHRLFVITARKLARRGIASLRFDFRGAGDSAGDFNQMSLSSMLQDARSALDFLQGQQQIEPRLIGLLGYSLGGLVAQLFLPEARNVRCCVLWAPVCDPRAAVARKASGGQTAKLVLHGVVDLDGWPVGRRLVVEMQTARPLKKVIRSTAPILLLHGDQDESVPLSDSQSCLRALQTAGREASLKIIRDAGHTFDALPLQEELINATVDWFQRHLTAGR